MMDTPPPPRTFEARLGQYSTVIVVIGGLLGIVAWFPTFTSKQQELSAFALLKDNPSGLLLVHDLGPVDAKQHRYDVAYSLLLKNTANGDFDVAWSLDQLFIGTPKAREAGGKALVVNDPPSVWDDASPGFVDWTQTSYDLATDELAEADGDVANAARKGWRVTDPGGGLTGRYIAGHIGAVTARYLITATPDTFVNVTITYGMDRPATLWQRLTGKPAWLRFNEDLAGETVRLGDAAQPGCPFGIAVANSQIKTACAAAPL